ncbi:four helix bundle protein [Chryseobacterium sp. 2TAF14]|jgi:four helix bundle protein|uniref:four helix bundle protein n=1 Tax=Chryseobacterium sp. 2TAF14 TaxID=3233007 RepID=UPI003F928A53
MTYIKFHKDLIVYQKAFSAAMEIFHISKLFPAEEKYSLTDQIRRSSRSVNANITEAWRKRRYEKSFINKLNDADGEAAETQNWLDFAFACKYIDEKTHLDLYKKYDEILGIIVSMTVNSKKWTFSETKNTPPNNSNTQ